MGNAFIKIDSDDKHLSAYDEALRYWADKTVCIVSEEAKVRRIKHEINKSLTPKKIIRSKYTTIVLWEDGTKTIVRCEAHRYYDAYAAFTAALAKKIYGNNTRLKKLIAEKFYWQD